jgi:hypothetical protein
MKDHVTLAPSAKGPLVASSQNWVIFLGLMNASNAAATEQRISIVALATRFVMDVPAVEGGYSPQFSHLYAAVNPTIRADERSETKLVFGSDAESVVLYRVRLLSSSFQSRPDGTTGRR